MMNTILDLHALGPLLLRDGRPFAGGDEESRAQSLLLPLPSTLAGFVRTQVGEARGLRWRTLSDEQLHRELQNLHDSPVTSLLLRDGQPVFPAPLNAVVDNGGKVYRSAPVELSGGEGVNLPEGQNRGLRPALLQGVNDHFKPASGYTYWPHETMQEWLQGVTPSTVEKIGGPQAEERTHLAMDSVKNVGQEGKLFSVTYRSFETPAAEKGETHRWSLRLRTGLQGQVAPVGHLGGERRPVTLHPTEDGWPGKKTFQPVVDKLLNPSTTRICCVLTTPALFTQGWKPGWLDLPPQQAEQHSGSGLPAGVLNLVQHTQLVGATVGKRIPVSGWNLRSNQPKRVRWAVPAGSVYFFEVTGNLNREKLVDMWLKPLSDNLEDRRDGFGCALWGVW